MRKAVYPGSFDPLTNGHLDIIERARSLVDELIVSVVVNPAKHSMFSLEERLDMLRAAVRGWPEVRVDCFEGLLVDYLRKQGSRLVIKGVRGAADFEFEAQMAHLNKSQIPELETVFLVSSPAVSFVSSSFVREIARLGGSVAHLVPAQVVDRLRSRLSSGVGSGPTS